MISKKLNIDTPYSAYYLLIESELPLPRLPLRFAENSAYGMSIVRLPIPAFALNLSR